MIEGLQPIGGDALQILMVFVIKLALESMIFDATHAPKEVVGAKKDQTLAEDWPRHQNRKTTRSRDSSKDAKIGVQVDPAEAKEVQICTSESIVRGSSSQSR